MSFSDTITERRAGCFIARGYRRLRCPFIYWRHSGAGAFGGCSKLASLTLPPKMKKISAYFCLDCKSLREVTLPPALTSIGTESFAGTALETVTIPATVTTMKARALIFQQHGVQLCPLQLGGLLKQVLHILPGDELFRHHHWLP